METQTLFDHAAQDYDRTRRQYIPCFDDFYGTVLELLPFNEQAAVHILDLGAGTGLLAALVAELFPRAQITLLDISPNMLAMAHQRFGSRTRRIQYRVVDYVHAPLDAEFDAEFDAVVSALSLHHTPGEALGNVFGKIHGVLRAGGIFINADQVLGPTPAIEAHYERVWQRQIRALGCSQHDIEVAVERMRADRTIPLADQLRYLRKAGFSGVNCWYKQYRFAVYSGTA